MIGTVWYQEIRNKTSAKTGPKSEVMERREENTPTNLTKVYKMVMFNQESP